MTLQASGAIKLSDIQTEFGGTNPIAISEYYGSDTVPASGVISLSDFYGTSSVPPVSFTNDPYTATNTGASPIVACTLSFTSGGSVIGTNMASGSWDGGNTVSGSDYDIRITALTGDALGGGSLAEDTWYNLNTLRTYSVVTSTQPSSKSASFTIEIRDANTLSVIDTATGSLTATST